MLQSGRCCKRATRWLQCAAPVPFMVSRLQTYITWLSQICAGLLVREPFPKCTQPCGILSPFFSLPGPCCHHSMHRPRQRVRPVSSVPHSARGKQKYGCTNVRECSRPLQGTLSLSLTQTHTHTQTCACAFPPALAHGAESRQLHQWQQFLFLMVVQGQVRRWRAIRGAAPPLNP
eukprot:448405-Pelagomonas_calceolata.AAC.1